MSSTSQRACKAGGIIIAPGVSPGIRALLRSEPAKRATEDPSGDFRRGAVNKLFYRPFGASDLFYVMYPGLRPAATFCRPLRGLVVAYLFTGVLLAVTPAQTVNYPRSFQNSENSPVRVQSQTTLRR